jgi:hypothetical protein
MKTDGAGKRTMLIAASAMVAFLALGCGEQKERAAIETSATPAAALEQTPTTAVAATAVTTPEASVGGEGLGASTDSLPPDVTAFAPDSLVTPGSVVEITAQASTDAGMVMLTDGLGHKYPFAYDTDAKAWRVRYRVPIQTHLDRLGLSVTATNGTNRWKRVWVFLKVEGGVPAESDGR